MKSLEISRSISTPNIFFDVENNHFEISGVSISEDAFEFYKPVLNWLDEYKKSPNKTNCLSINLGYFNSSTSVIIAKIVKMMKDIRDAGNKVEVKWYYNEDDIEILEYGEELQSLFDLPFKFFKN